MIAPRHGNYFALEGVTHRPFYTMEGGDDDSVEYIYTIEYLEVLLRSTTPRGRRHGRFGVVAQIAQIEDSAAARQKNEEKRLMLMNSGGRANATWSDVVGGSIVVLSMGCPDPGPLGDLLGGQASSEAQYSVTQASSDTQYSVIGGGNHRKKRKNTPGHIILVERQRLREKAQRLTYNGIRMSHQVLGALIKITASPDDDGRPPSSTPASAAGRRPDTPDDDDGRPAVEEKTRPPATPPASAAGRCPDTPDDDDGRPAVEEKTRPPATPASTVKEPCYPLVVERGVVAERVVEAAAASSGAAGTDRTAAAARHESSGKAEARPGARPGGGADDGPGAPAVWPPEAPQQRGEKKKLWSEEVVEENSGAEEKKDDEVPSRWSSGPKVDNDEALRLQMSEEEVAATFEEVLRCRDRALEHEAREMETYLQKEGAPPLPEADHRGVSPATIHLLTQHRRAAMTTPSGSQGEDKGYHLQLVVVDDDLRRRVRWYYYHCWSNSRKVGGIRRYTCTDPGRAQKKKKKKKKKRNA